MSRGAPADDPLDPATIATDLGTALLPRTISCHAAVGSTMDVARDLLRTLDDAQLPLLITADVQTAGRGRMGRRWEAPAGSALLLSLALRPTWLPPERGVVLVWMAAVALCEAVEDVTPLRAALKWPNDLLLPTPDGWAKAAGILLEVSIGHRAFEWAIIGCGVNVSDAPPPGATPYPTTSLAAAAGGSVSRLVLLRALLRRLNYWYTQLSLGQQAELFAAWSGRLITLGQQVRVEAPDGQIMGYAEGVEPSGALRIRDAAGAMHVITAGDVGLVV